MGKGRKACRVRSAVLRGVEAVPVDVEVTVSEGLPGFSIVGMADASVQESRERVRAALRSSGFSMPNGRIVVNLSPCDLRKSGSGFDLPIAAALLVATGQIEPSAVGGALLVGELSLLGEVRPVQGLLSFGLAARDTGLKLVCAPEAEGLSMVEGLSARRIETVSALRTGEAQAPREAHGPQRSADIDYADVAGCEQAKRALQIAAAGEHPILLAGEPGTAKSMLASRLPTILPPMGGAEALESAATHSAAGEPLDGLRRRERPLRRPHHSASLAALVGGGSPVRPGEAALAHNGVLLLDDLQEFVPAVLFGLAQAYEAGCVMIVRADGRVAYPTRFLMAATALPCPCGHYGGERAECDCLPEQIRIYRERLGGPLSPLFDVRVEVGAEDGLSAAPRTSSEELREGVIRARDFAAWRHREDGAPSGSPTLGEAARACVLEPEDEESFRRACRTFGMDGRAAASVLAVARTIADMDERVRVGRAELYEALSLRC